MKQYKVTGMSCAACSARVERAVSALDGVDSCAVNLLTNSMAVDGSASDSDIIAAVKNAGYGAAPVSEKSKKDDRDKISDNETRPMVQRLIWSVGFLLILMYISMGHSMWGWPLPSAISENYMALGLIQLLLCVIVMVINQKFFISGTKALLHRAPNMDTLVSLGAAAAFVYSTWALFAMTGAYASGDADAAMHYMHEFYFESCAMILTLITVGKTLEARSKGKTTGALRALMDLAPKTAILIREGEEVEVPVDQVRIGDIFAVRPGGSIPVDGTVIEGHSAVDESSLTGESIPVDKEVDSRVFAGCVNQSGFMKCRADKIGEDTTISQIIKLVSDAAATKAPIAKIADKVSGVFVPTVMAIALVTAAVWLIVGETVGFALARGVSVLVISCPCALGLATPVAIMVGSGVGARSGILFKSAAALEEAGKTDTVVLDKTGTVTKGEPRVTDIVPADGVDENELVRIAGSLEKSSEHPLASAVLSYANDNNIAVGDVTEFEAMPGNGLCAVYEGKRLFGGKIEFAKQFTEVDESISEAAKKLSDEGKTPLFFGADTKLLGVIAVADTIKEDSRTAVTELKRMGIEVVMLTGDNKRCAEAVGKAAGIDNIISDVLPADKERAVSQFMTRGKVAMVGDGINDAPALTRADTGIAIGRGTDIAIDAADVVLMNSALTDVSAAIRLSRKTLKNIKENLFWAFFYNVIGIPIAAGVFIPVFEWQLDPMFAAAAMSLSSFCVVSNALRLNFADIYSANHDVKRKNKKIKEIKIMEKTIRIEGMMCGHCSGRVQKALEALDGVESADVSHERGDAVVKLSAPVADDVLKSAIEAEGYKVVG